MLLSESMDDEPKVEVDGCGPEVLVLRSLDSMELEARLGGANLEFEGTDFSGFCSSLVGRSRLSRKVQEVRTSMKEGGYLGCRGISMSV
ncbi:MAG: hypothetical protein SGI92_21375 [Bryobacteraceae bacterium]|nr:hypothetical protein [Bryobacteraceae bacterium]